MLTRLCLTFYQSTHSTDDIYIIFKSCGSVTSRENYKEVAFGNNGYIMELTKHKVTSFEVIHLLKVQRLHNLTHLFFLTQEQSHKDPLVFTVSNAGDTTFWFS